MVAMLRAELIKAGESARKLELRSEDKDQEPEDKQESDEKDAPAPARDLRLEALAKVLSGELTLMVIGRPGSRHCQRIAIGQKFNLKIWLDSAAESYLLLDEIPLPASRC